MSGHRPGIPAPSGRGGGQCHTHYVHRRGLPLEPPIKPHRKRRQPRTTRYKDRRGYIRVYRPDHPNATAWAGSTSTSWS
jgi:hypothetical protein